MKYGTMKKPFTAIKYKEKMIFRNNYSTLDQSLSLWVLTYYFIKIFVQIDGWGLANIYSFKVKIMILEKGVNYVQS